MTNCLYEAALQKIGRDCNCIPSNFAKYLDTKLPSCFGRAKRCMSDIMERIGEERFIDDDGEKKECLAACEDQQHQFLVTTSTYPNKESFHLVSGSITFSDELCWMGSMRKAFSVQ